ncbi:MAG: hypothetical protein MEQ07_06655 [Aquimonas sp.]|nr:hypothetical protein [Aquimonas sp.]
MPALLETLLAVLLCVGVAFLPPWLVLLVWLGSLAAFAASFAIERRGQGTAPHFPRALSGLMPLALAASLTHWAWPLIGPLSLLLGLCVAALGVFAHSRLFGWLLRPREAVGARFPFTSEHALSGPGGHVWSRLPGSGLRFRMVPGAKPRSSQPQGCTWVLEDGHVLEGRDRSLHVSRDGRWVVVRSLRGGGVVALDRQAARRYGWDDGIELWSQVEASERWPRAMESWRGRANRDELLLLRFGLWITEAEWLQAAPERIDVPDPLGRPRLQLLALREPQHAAAATLPLQYALQPQYAARFDSVLLPFSLASAQSAVWRADGRALLLQPEDGQGAWLHEDGREPRRFPLRWPARHGHPALNVGRVRVLERERFALELRQGLPSAGYPQAWEAASADGGIRYTSSVAWAEPAPDGAVYYEERDIPGDLLLWLRLDDPEDTTARAEVESLGPGGRVAVFSRSAERCWRCRLGGEPLAPSPLALAHVWSDDGAHLVLQPAAPEGAVPESCLVVETATGTVLSGVAQGFDLRPVAMVGGVLQVRQVLGRVPAAAPITELLQPPPPPARGAAFLEPRRNSWLRLGCERYVLNVSGEGLDGPLDRTVRVRVPPSPLAAFELIYPSPSGGWAHVQGARGRNDDASPRPQDARFAASIVVHSGFACSGMSPAMVWSADGRWLLLVHAPDPALPSWTPWLLDTLNDRLHRPHGDDPGHGMLPGMPFFIGFHGGVVRYEYVEQPIWSAGMPRRSGVLPLEALLARFRAEPLEVVQGIRVPSEQAALNDWRDLTRRALRSVP